MRIQEFGRLLSAVPRQGVAGDRVHRGGRLPGCGGRGVRAYCCLSHEEQAGRQVRWVFWTNIFFPRRKGSIILYLFS